MRPSRDCWVTDFPNADAGEYRPMAVAFIDLRSGKIGKIGKIEAIGLRFQWLNNLSGNLSVIFERKDWGDGRMNFSGF